jgi:hypothetical protein
MVASLQKDRFRGIDFQCKKVDDDLYAKDPSVNVVPEKLESFLCEVWVHDTEHLHQVMILPVYIPHYGDRVRQVDQVWLCKKNRRSPLQNYQNVGFEELSFQEQKIRQDFLIDFSGFVVVQKNLVKGQRPAHREGYVPDHSVFTWIFL